MAWQGRHFIAARGKRRFFLHMMTVSSHHPYVGICPTHTGGANGLAWKKGSVTLARKPYNSTRQRGMLRAYLRELRCVDEYIRQVHGILKRAGRLHDTSLVIVGDHGEGFELAHEHDRVHGGTVYETQVRLDRQIDGYMDRSMERHHLPHDSHATRFRDAGTPNPIYPIYPIYLSIRCGYRSSPLAQ